MTTLSEAIKLGIIYLENGHGEENIDLITDSVYCMLTVDGTRNFEKIFPDIEGIDNSLVKSLVNHAKNTLDISRSLKIVQKLDFSEIPHYKSNILSSLTSMKAFENFFFKVCTNDLQKKKYHSLIICTIILTFMQRVLNQDLTNISDEFNVITEGLTDLFTTESAQLPAEYTLIALDFLDSCTNNIDQGEVSITIQPIFGYPMLKSFVDEGALQFDEDIMDEIENSYSEGLYFMLLEKSFTEIVKMISNPESPDYSIYVNILILVVQIATNVTCNKGLGKPMAILLTQELNTSRTYIDMFKTLPRMIPMYERKLQGMIEQLLYNFSVILNQSKAIMDQNVFKKAVSCDSPFFDEKYIIDLISSNLYVPRMVTCFLDVRSYAISTFILYKELTALDTWEDICNFFNNDELANGQLSQCTTEPSNDSNGIKVYTDLYTEDRIAILLCFEEGEVKHLSFVDIKSAFEFPENYFYNCILKTGSNNINYNMIYTCDPRSGTNFQMLENALKLGLNSSDMKSESTISKLWIGVEDSLQLVKLQTKKNEDIPFMIDFGGAISDISSIGRVLTMLKSDLNIPTKLKADINIRDYSYINIPGNSDTTKIFYDITHKNPCIPDNFVPTEEQQFSIVSSLFFPFTLIQGPPGTGKTETMLIITRVLCHNLNVIGFPKPVFPHRHINDDFYYEEEDSSETYEKVRPFRILVCAHSNAALDQMIVELHKNGLDVFRFGGNPTPEGECLTAHGRLMIEVKELCDIIDRNPNYKSNPKLENIIKFIKVLSMQPFKKFGDYIRDNYAFLESSFSLIESLRISKNSLRISEIYRHIMMRHSALADMYMTKIGIMGCTICNASKNVQKLKKYNAKVIIIEEAAKVLETEMLSFLLLDPRRIILIGDQAQLTPVVKCDDVRLNGRFNMSLFERMHRTGIRSVQLSYQGRAKTQIADLYRNRYQTVLKDLPNVSKLPTIKPLDYPVQFIDIEKVAQVGPMKNKEEAIAIVQTLKMLQDSGVDLQNVSVLSPYKNQKMLLIDEIKANNLKPRDICTVDEFQGLQNLVIMVSLVSKSPSIWLRDHRRINVLTSRSRSALLLFGCLEGFFETSEWEEIINTIDKVHEAGMLYINGESLEMPQ